MHEPLGADDPYVTAGKRLARWRRQTTLVTDPEPGLYVYEYGDAEHQVCGIVGALELRKRDSGVVLPHEGVIPAIVADRLAMMVAAQANLEPILLVYDGDRGRERVHRPRARDGTPLTDVVASDGTFHRLWSITDPATLQQIRDGAEAASGADRGRPPPLRDVPASSAGGTARSATGRARGTAGSRCSSTSRSSRCSSARSTAASPRWPCRR